MSTKTESLFARLRRDVIAILSIACVVLCWSCNNDLNDQLSDEQISSNLFGISWKNVIL